MTSIVRGGLRSRSELVLADDGSHSANPALASLAPFTNIIEMAMDEIYNTVLDVLHKHDGKCLDNDDERDEVAMALTAAIKQWFANS